MNSNEILEVRAQSLKNYNEAFSSSFELVINRFPELLYFVTSVTLPSVTVDGVRTTFKNQRTFYSDNVIEYGQLILTFQVDEDFENYDALFKEFKLQEKASEGNGGNIKEILHDLTLIRLSSNKVPIALIKFTDASLTSLGSINYTTTSSEADIIICDITFNVTEMVIEPLRKSNLLDGSLTCN